MAGVQGTYGWVVQSGAVTFSASLTFNVAAIAAGDYTVNSVMGAAYSANTVAVGAQDATNPRVDLIVITSAGAVSVVAGVAAALTATSGPVPPTPSSAQLELARIWVPSTGTALSGANITDRHHPLAVPFAARPEFLWPDIHGGSAAAQTLTANVGYLIPVRPITKSQTLTSVNLSIGTSSGNIDVGLYSTVDGVTFTRVVSSGTTAAPAAGTRSITVATTVLTPGTRYYFAVAADNATITLNGYSGTNRIQQEVLRKATSFVLPASIVSPTVETTVFPYIDGTIS